MTDKKKDEIIQVPEKVFRDPAEVSRDPRLSRDEKIKVLENWAMDERAQMVADDEYMTVNTPVIPAPGEVLKKIHTEERKLGMAPTETPEECNTSNESG